MWGSKQRRIESLDAEVRRLNERLYDAQVTNAQLDAGLEAWVVRAIRAETELSVLRAEVLVRGQTDMRAENGAAFEAAGRAAREAVAVGRPVDGALRVADVAVRAEEVWGGGISHEEAVRRQYRRLADGGWLSGDDDEAGEE